MKKILLTTFIALGFGFAAMAQMEPVKAKANKKTPAIKKAEEAAILKYKMDTEKAAQQSAKPVAVNSTTADKASEVYKKN